MRSPNFKRNIQQISRCSLQVLLSSPMDNASHTGLVLLQISFQSLVGSEPLQVASHMNQFRILKRKASPLWAAFCTVQVQVSMRETNPSEWPPSQTHTRSLRGRQTPLGWFPHQVAHPLLSACPSHIWPYSPLQVSVPQSLSGYHGILVLDVCSAQRSSNRPFTQPTYLRCHWLHALPGGTVLQHLLFTDATNSS